MIYCECRNKCDGNKEYVEIVWCPTWINKGGQTIPEINKDWKLFKRKNKFSDHPPMYVCAECAKTFKPEFNKNCDGIFYWNEEANKQFKIHQELNKE